MIRIGGVSWLAVAVVASSGFGSARAAAYRCDGDGRTIYSDRPCGAGRQAELAIADQEPTAADRAAAAARLRSDKAAAAAMQRDRERREKPERVTNRAASDPNKQAGACAKLALRARRAHEDFDSAAPREQPKKRVRMRRADEDYAALCKR